MGKRDTKANVFLILALAVIIGARLMPGIGGLSADAMAVLGVFFGSLIMWIGISIDWPSMITLLALGIIPVFGFSGTFAGALAHDGGILDIHVHAGISVVKDKFCEKMYDFIYHEQKSRKGPWYFICFLFAAVTFMGLFISPSVLFVAFMPFLEDIFQVLELKKGGKAANVIMMGTAFCISLSSGMTAIGHVWPTMAIGYYTAATGNDVNQFQYMAMGIPTGIILIIL